MVEIKGVDLWYRQKPGRRWHLVREVDASEIHTVCDRWLKGPPFFAPKGKFSCNPESNLCIECVNRLQERKNKGRR